MSCSTCTPVVINCCSDELVIGDYPNNLNSYYLKIVDVSNNRTTYIPLIQTGTFASVDISGMNFPDTHSFEFYVVNVDELQINLSWVINGTSVDCLQVRFQKSFDSNDELFIETTQVITL